MIRPRQPPVDRVVALRPSQPPFTYRSCWVESRSRVFLTAILDDITDGDADQTKLIVWNEGGIRHYPVGWLATSVVAVPGVSGVLAMGLDGQIDVVSEAGVSAEQVDPSNEGPSLRGVLTEMRLIHGRAHVVGMGRQAYRRDAPGVWTRIDGGMVTPRGERGCEGLLSIDGTADGCLYAVGFQGAIWYNDRRRWTEVDSPSYVSLHRVLAAEDGWVYACGSDGELLRGRGATWDVVPTGDVWDSFWGMAMLEGTLFLAGSRALYSYGRRGLERVETGLPSNFTFGFLHANDGVLWSVGEKDLAYFDGTVWREVVPR